MQHIDPICGMTVDPARAAGTSERDGETFYFCSKHCKAKFDAETDRLLGSSAPRGHGESIAPEDPRTRGPREWTCPMHPEIVRDAPGSCPICGMALEPHTAALDAGSPELRDMTRRLAVSAALTAPLVAASMAEMLGAPIHALSPGALAWLQLALATPVVAWAGAPLFARGVRSIVLRKLNMFTLIAIGIATAYGFSVIALVAGGALPEAFRGHGGAPAVYFEPAAVITALVPEMPLSFRIGRYPIASALSGCCGVRLSWRTIMTRPWWTTGSRRHESFLNCRTDVCNSGVGDDSGLAGGDTARRGVER